MRLRLYIDEDSMSHSLVTGLRARGADVMTVAEEGNTGLGDREQLEFSTQHGRVLYTSNTRDFYCLHTEYSEQGKTHSGMIFVPQQKYGIGEQIRRLLKLIRIKTPESMMNHAEFLSSW